VALIFSDSELALHAETTNNTLHRMVMRIDHARWKVLTVVFPKSSILGSYAVLTGKQAPTFLGTVSFQNKS
jgi:hypothetical protein